MVLALEPAMSLLDSLVVSVLTLGVFALFFSSFLALLILVPTALRLMAEAERLFGVLFFLPLVFEMPRSIAPGPNNAGTISARRRRCADDKMINLPLFP